MNSEIYGVERAHNSSKFEEIQSKGRLKSLQGIADRNNTISFIRWLKEGKTVLYAPDQDYGAKKSEIVSFFNIPAATISAPFKIINLTKCKPFFLDSFYKEDIKEKQKKNTERNKMLMMLGKYGKKLKV